MKRLKIGNRGEGLVSHVGFVLLAFVIIALFLAVTPVFLQKQQLDTYANELCRTAEISGRVDEETNKRSKELQEQTGLTPKVDWSSNGKIQLGNKITVTLKSTYDIGFGGLVLTL